MAVLLEFRLIAIYEAGLIGLQKVVLVLKRQIAGTAQNALSI